MAEVAAGLLVAEQVVSTVVEGGVVVGIAVAQPTMPLKAILNQIATAPRDDSTLALARSHLSVTVVGKKAYIFGGETGDGHLASNDIHTISIPQAEKSDGEYACYPATPLNEGGEVPSARTRHATCSRGNHLVLFGGCTASGSPVDETCIWLWDVETLRWAKVASVSAEPSDVHPSPRFGHDLFSDTTHDTIILHGGWTSTSDEQLKDTWVYDFSSQKWSRLPDAPAASNAAAFSNDTLYSVTGQSDVSSEMHTFDMNHASSASWHTITFPTNPLIPGPRPREGAALLPVTTGYGRLFLVYVFGMRLSKADVSSEEASELAERALFLPDIWTYQIESKDPKPTTWTDLKPAAVKDTIRQKLGYDSGAHSWGEVEVLATEQIGHEGKVHPGPRAFFGADVTEDGKGVVLWGGLNPKGERESDSWLVQLQ